MEELRGCALKSSCPYKYLCCNFCTDSDCWKRCMDDIIDCPYRDELPPEPEDKEDSNKKSK